MKKIFIQIASYRDPQLVPTIQSALENAVNPWGLSFGICHQFSADDAWDSLAEYTEDPRFRILAVPFQDSRGACWARSEVQKLWQGEEYTLQLDSHHRFAEGWDVALMDMLERAESDKPIITGYIPSFNIETEERCSKLWAMRPNYDHLRIITTFHPEDRADAGLRKHMFWSGHFMFTFGEYCEEVRYDPDLYFIGEEISMAVRSWTHGYDMFLPDRNVVWHEYTREGRSKHWGDHTVQNGFETAFHDRDVVSKERVKALLTGSNLFEYGLGSVRTLEQFENMSGISFSNSYIAPEAKVNLSLPDFASSVWKKCTNYRFTCRLDLKAILPRLGRADGFALFVKDTTDTEIYRKDFSIDAKLPDTLVVTMDSTHKPESFMIWMQNYEPFEWLKCTRFPVKDYDAEKL